MTVNQRKYQKKQRQPSKVSCYVVLRPLPSKFSFNRPALFQRVGWQSAAFLICWQINKFLFLLSSKLCPHYSHSDSETGTELLVIQAPLMKVKEKNEKVGLKLNIQKTKIMASGPITSWQTDGETVADFIFLGSKITADGDCSHEIKTLALCPTQTAY